MRRLILLRHAKTETVAASGDDFDRALTPRGQADAARMGQLLMDEGLKPDLALVSAGVRARQTWEILRGAFGEVEAEVLPALYLASAERLRELIEDREARAGTLLVVAHNPGIHDLALRLLREGSASASQMAKVQNGFPTATAAVFEIDEAGRPSYDGYFTPKDHGGGATPA
jgi:phosphohistidine phosphatase